MQFVAAGSTVQRPELMVKNCCALVKPTIMSRKAPHVPPMQGRPEGYSIFELQANAFLYRNPPQQIRSLRRLPSETPAEPQQVKSSQVIKAMSHNLTLQSES